MPAENRSTPEGVDDMPCPFGMVMMMMMMMMMMVANAVLVFRFHRASCTAYFVVPSSGGARCLCTWC
jgi:hypothetical protein